MGINSFLRFVAGCHVRLAPAQDWLLIIVLCVSSFVAFDLWLEELVPAEVLEIVDKITHIFNYFFSTI